MKTLKELDEMRYAYRKKVRLQKYKNINSQMAFRNKDCKDALPEEWSPLVSPHSDHPQFLPMFIPWK